MGRFDLNLVKPLADIEKMKYHLMYLPYEVQVWCPHLIWSGNPPEPSHDEMGLDILTFEGLLGYSQWPLALRPISDIRNQITIDGETFVPLERLSTQFNLNLDILKDVNIFIQDTKYSDIEKLKEWHFDFLDLIGQYIAVNINEV